MERIVDNLNSEARLAAKSNNVDKAKQLLRKRTIRQGEMKSLDSQIMQLLNQVSQISIASSTKTVTEALSLGVSLMEKIQIDADDVEEVMIAIDDNNARLNEVIDTFNLHSTNYEDEEDLEHQLEVWINDNDSDVSVEGEGIDITLPSAPGNTAAVTADGVRVDEELAALIAFKDPPSHDVVLQKERQVLLQKATCPANSEN